MREAAMETREGYIWHAGESMFFLYDTATQEALSQAVEMTAAEARERNNALRSEGDSARWIPAEDGEA
jgi:hypothetical protein